MLDGIRWVKPVGRHKATESKGLESAVAKEMVAGSERDL